MRSAFRSILFNSAKSTAASAVLSAAVFAGMMPAEAADLLAPMPVKAAPFVPAPVFSWSGWYVGLHGGYGWGHDDAGVTIDPASFPMLPNEAVSPPIPGPIALGGSNPQGALAGGQFGYNFQVDRAVFGFEADISWSDLKSSRSAGFAFNLTDSGDIGKLVGTGTAETRLDWFGTVRGRVGYAFDRFLPYVTGGLAYGDIKRTLTFTGTTFDTGTTPPILLGQTGGTASTSSVHFGWAAGVGADFAVTDRWVLRAEYMHLNFDGSGSTFAFAGGSLPDHGMSVDLARAAVNYRF